VANGRRQAPTKWIGDPRDWFGQLRDRLEDVVRDIDLAPQAGWIQTTPGEPRWMVSEAVGRVAMDARDAGDRYELTFDLPGMDKDEVEVITYDDRVVVRGERQGSAADQDNGVLRAERFLGRFERRVPLPDDVDSDRVRAEMKNGVLNISIPKSPDCGGREINIQ